MISGSISKPGSCRHLQVSYQVLVRYILKSTAAQALISVFIQRHPPSKRLSIMSCPWMSPQALASCPSRICPGWSIVHKVIYSNNPKFILQGYHPPTRTYILLLRNKLYILFKNRKLQIRPGYPQLIHQAHQSQPAGSSTPSYLYGGASTRKSATAHPSSLAQLISLILTLNAPMTSVTRPIISGVCLVPGYFLEPCPERMTAQSS